MHVCNEYQLDELNDIIEPDPLTLQSDCVELLAQNFKKDIIRDKDDKINVFLPKEPSSSSSQLITMPWTAKSRARKLQTSQSVNSLSSPRKRVTPKSDRTTPLSARNRGVTPLQGKPLLVDSKEKIPVIAIKERLPLHSAPVGAVREKKVTTMREKTSANRPTVAQIKSKQTAQAVAISYVLSDVTSSIQNLGDLFTGNKSFLSN